MVLNRDVYATFPHSESIRGIPNRAFCVRQRYRGRRRRIQSPRGCCLWVGQSPHLPDDLQHFILLAQDYAACFHAFPVFPRTVINGRVHIPPSCIADPDLKARLRIIATDSTGDAEADGRVHLGTGWLPAEENRRFGVVHGSQNFWYSIQHRVR